MSARTPSRTSRRALVAGLVALSLLGAGQPAEAHPPDFAPDLGFDVIVEDDAGRPLESFWHRGQRFVMGHYGDRYAVRLVNRTARRVEAVLSIDGLDAVSGRKGDYVRQRGYLVAPFDSVVVTGFRRSLSEVAAFRFTSPGDSYSSRMGTPQNVGVVGVAFFAERRRRDVSPPTPIARPRERHAPRRNPNPRAGGAAAHDDGSREKSAAASRAPSARPSEHPAYADLDRESAGDTRDNLGTRYGESRPSDVVEVPFARETRSRPTAVMTVRYDDRAGLEARGIAVRPPPIPRPRPWWRRREPVAFPESRFAPPPP